MKVQSKEQRRVTVCFRLPAQQLAELADYSDYFQQGKGVLFREAMHAWLCSQREINPLPIKVVDK